MENKTRKLIKSALVVGALAIAGCTREYPTKELSRLTAETNNIDQVFLNNNEEVWATVLGEDKRLIPVFLGNYDHPGKYTFVRMFKDLKRGKTPYLVGYYSNERDLVQREIHLPEDTQVQPTSETHTRGKTTYRVDNWEVR